MRVPRVHPYQAVRVIYQFMNNVVMFLMQSANAGMNRGTINNDENLDTSLLLVSEHAVVSYCQLYHLLTLSASKPQVLREAPTKHWRFLADPKTRTKAYVPDMGKLIVVASLMLGCSSTVNGSQQVTWKYHLNGPVLEEVFIGNVR
jgi:hypothetical protein